MARDPRDLNYQEFLNEFSIEINNRDFCSPVFDNYRQKPVWTRLIMDLSKLGINPLENQVKVPSSFFANSNITKVDLPKTIEDLGMNTFWNCTRLKSVYVPDRVKKLEFSVFAYCESLESLSLPEDLEFIGSCAVQGCFSLKEIEYRGPSTKWAKIGKSRDWKEQTPLERIKCTDWYVKV